MDSAVKAAASAGRAVVGWWTSPMPLARIAFLRTAIYVFIVIDILIIRNDVVAHSYAPEFYQPKLIGRLLPLPTPSVELARVLQVVIIAGVVAIIAGYLPRFIGWIVGLAYLQWLVISMGYGYVAHDHMALVVAALVLPTAPAARYTSADYSQAAGWALRCMQVSVIATYFGSAITKWVRSGSPQAWANGAVFVWAIMRRGTDASRWLLDFPWLLTIGQWGLLLFEYLSPVVLFLKRRALALAIGVFLLFHLVTFISLGIHFLPTAVCWLAFMPMERIPAWVQRRGWRRHTEPSSLHSPA